MNKTAQFTSTQKFIEILDIREDIVLLHGGNACIIIELQSVNFALLSKEEQDAKVYGYAALLNSLSFPVQIVVRSKQIEILPYIHSLEDAAKKTTNQKLAQNIMQYKEFVEKLVTMTTVLDKQFYMVVSYSSLEEGVGGIAQITQTATSNLDDFFIGAKASLHTKADSLLSQISRMSIKATVLEKDALVHLFHDIYNQESAAPHEVAEHTITATQGGKA